MIKLAFKNRAYAGQSMVEYAGALVVAAILIAGVLPLVTNDLTVYYQNVFAMVSNYILQDG